MNRNFKNTKTKSMHKKMMKRFASSMLSTSIICCTIFSATISVSADEIKDPIIQMLNIETESESVEETIDALEVNTENENMEENNNEKIMLPEIELIAEKPSSKENDNEETNGTVLDNIISFDEETNTINIDPIIEYNLDATDEVEDNDEEVTGPATDSSNIIESNIGKDDSNSGPGAVIQEPDYESFEYCDPYTLYVKNTWVYVRSLAVVDDGENILGSLPPLSPLTVVGYNTHDRDWVVIDYNGQPGFVYNSNLQESVPESDTYNNDWSGEKLNRRNGIVKGPSGNETYYNLNMKNCVKIMNNKGYYGEVWTRSDGVKMFGNYVMVAADLSIRPKGSLVETTLGTGIVVDTGSFVNWDNTRLDIAVSW